MDPQGDPQGGPPLGYEVFAGLGRKRGWAPTFCDCPPQVWAGGPARGSTRRGVCREPKGGGNLPPLRGQNTTTGGSTDFTCPREVIPNDSQDSQSLAQAKSCPRAFGVLKCVYFACPGALGVFKCLGHIQMRVFYMPRSHEDAQMCVCVIYMSQSPGGCSIHWVAQLLGITSATFPFQVWLGMWLGLVQLFSRHVLGFTPTISLPRSDGAFAWD
jgi:hypothetical protein